MSWPARIRKVSPGRFGDRGDSGVASRGFTDEEMITCMRLVARLTENLEAELAQQR
jgi:hypothetical protein